MQRRTSIATLVVLLVHDHLTVCSACACVFAGCSCCPSASLLIVGTKSDLVEQIAISADDGSRQASEWGCTHLTVSAKTGVNVDGMFALMLAVIKKKTQA